MSKTFADFPLHESLQQALQSLGFTSPTPVQEQLIPAALENQRKANAEISAKIRAATLQNEQKAKELEAEKAKNAAVKADLGKTSRREEGLHRKG